MAGDSGFVDIDGETLEVFKISGRNRHLPTLVLLHEGLGCVQAWKNFPLVLAEQSGHPVVVYSRAGYGKSSARKRPLDNNFMHEQALEVLPRLLHQLEITDYILVGHSDGGSISLIHAGLAPQPGLKAVVTMAPHVFVESLTVDSIHRLKNTYENNAVLSTGLAKYHGDKTETVFREWLNVWLDPQFADWNIESCLPTIGVTQLVLQGREDEYGTLAQVDAIVQKSGGSVLSVMLDECDHWPYRSQGNKTLESIVTYLRAL